MSRALSFFLFFAIALSLVGAFHYYVWARLVRDLALPVLAHRVLTGALVLLFLSVPATFFFGRRGTLEGTRPLVMAAFVWIGVLFLLVMLLAAVDLARLGGALIGRLLADAPPLDPERRTALARLVGAGVAVTAGGMGTVALRSGLHQLVVRDVQAALSRLPPALSGTTIVQLTDLHIGPTLQRDFVEQVVARTNALSPDVIVITGDLVDGSVSQLGHHVAPLARLSARYGVFFVTGNHEYYSGVAPWCRELERLGIRVLRNERVAIGTDAASFDLAGVDDYSAWQFGDGHGADLERALAGRDPERELVLLAHQPRAVFEAERRGVGLQLSGHTHGGQLWPWSYFVRLQQPVVSGLARFGSTLVYVSNGTGYWGPPMRLGAPAEITRVTLVRG